MADDEYMKLEDFASRNEKDLEIYEDPEEEENQVGKVRIRAVEPTFLVETFAAHDIDVPDGEEEMSFSPQENVTLMNEVLQAGLVKPEINSDADLLTLGKWKQQIFLAIIEFSGLAEADVDPEEASEEDEAFQGDQ